MRGVDAVGMLRALLTPTEHYCAAVAIKQRRVVRLVCHSKHSSFSNRASGSSSGGGQDVAEAPGGGSSSLHLGIGKYFRIEVAPCDEDIRDVPLISNENVRNGSTVEDMLDGLRPGECTSFILSSTYARSLASTQTAQPIGLPGHADTQALVGNSQYQYSADDNVGSVMEGAEQSVVEVGAKSLGELTSGIEKQIVDNERTLEAVLDIKMAESEESAHFSFVEATSKHLGTEAGEVFASKNGSCQQDDISRKSSGSDHSASHPFFQAAKANDVNQLKDMLTNNETIDVNMKESVYGGTALHYAASSVDMMLGSKDGSDNDDGKDISPIAYLCHMGGDVNAQSRNGSTPLHWAAGMGNIDAVKELLNHGADPTIKSYTWGRQVFGKGSGQLASHWACESGHTDIVALLMDMSPETILSIDERNQTPKDLAESELNDATVSMIEGRLEEKYVRLTVTLVDKKVFV